MLKALLAISLFWASALAQQPTFQHSVVPVGNAGNTYKLLLTPAQGVTITWVDAHFRVNDGTLENHRMTAAAAGGGSLEYGIITVNPGQKLRYFFTAEINGVAMDSPTYSYSDNVYTQKVYLVDRDQGVHKIVLTGSRPVTWAAIHVSPNGGQLLNYRMVNTAGAANTFEFPITLRIGDRIGYSFTFETQGISTDTERFTYIYGTSPVEMLPGAPASNVFTPTQPVRDSGPGPIPGSVSQQDDNAAPFETQIVQLRDASGGYEIVFISSGQADLQFVDVALSINGGVQMNYRMEPTSPRRFAHRRVMLNQGDVLRWQFIYGVGGVQQTTTQFSYTATTPGPLVPTGGGVGSGIPPPMGQGPSGLPPISGQGGQQQLPPVPGGNQGQGQGFPQQLPPANQGQGFPQQLPPANQGQGFPQQFPPGRSSTGMGLPPPGQMGPILGGQGLPQPGQMGSSTGFGFPMPQQPVLGQGPVPGQAPSPVPGMNCAETDYECQLRGVCQPCFSNPALPICQQCSALQACRSTLCQIQATCALCTGLGTSKPNVCSVLLCT